MLRHRGYHQTLIRRPVPAECDVYRLLLAFETAVRGGRALSFPTFIAIWQRMHFSYIFEVTDSCFPPGQPPASPLTVF